jgi:hypothetical protein
MSPWIAVIAVWLAMLVVVLLARRLASRETSLSESDRQALADGTYTPRSGWDELDTQRARHGAGHPLQ